MFGQQMSNNLWCPVLFSRHHNVDVSVAVSADSGLITPIVFNADKKVRNEDIN